MLTVEYFYAYIACIIRLATKLLRTLSIPPNDKIHNDLVANPIYVLVKLGQYNDSRVCSYVAAMKFQNVSYST